MGDHGNRINTQADGWSVIIHTLEFPGCGDVFYFTWEQVSCQGNFFLFVLFFISHQIISANNTGC